MKLGKARNKDRKIKRIKINLSSHRYQKPQNNISLHRLLLRIIYGGPELVGTEVMTRREAYDILWEKIFKDHARSGRHPKVPSKPIKQKSFNKIPRPIPAKFNPKITGKKYNPNSL